MFPDGTVSSTSFKTARFILCRFLSRICFTNKIGREHRSLTNRLTNTSCLGSYAAPLVSCCSSLSSNTSGVLVSWTWLWLKLPLRLPDEWWR